MKKDLRQFLAFLLVLSMTVGFLPTFAAAKEVQTLSAWPEVRNTRSSSGFAVGDSGTYVIAANVDGVYYAMSSQFSSKIAGTEISVIDGYVSEEEAAEYSVTLAYDGSSYTIYNGEYYLSYSSGTNLGASTSAYNWTVSAGTNGTWRITSATTTRGLLFRASTYNQFGGYALSNATAGSAEYYDVEILPIGTVADATTEVFDLVTSESDLTSGRYAILVAPSVTDSDYSFYALWKQEDSAYYAINVVGTSLTSLPASITASDGLIWTLNGDNSSLTIGGDDGSTLYNDPSSPTKLEYSATNTSEWTASYDADTLSFSFLATYYLSLRDDSTYVGDNSLPLVCCVSTTTVGSCNFYLYKSRSTTSCAHTNTETDSTDATCTEDGFIKVTCADCGAILSNELISAEGHSFIYTAAGDGTHVVTCANCEFSETADCALSDEGCIYCGWTEGAEITQIFSLVTSIDQITDGEYVLIVVPGGANPGSYSQYVLRRELHGTSYVVATGMSLDSIPSELEITDSMLIWTLTGDSAGFTLTGSDGSVLYNSNNYLYYATGTASTWVPTFANGTFTLCSGTKYLGLRDDLTTVASNGNPCFRCNSSASTSSYQFYLFKSGESDDSNIDTECQHASVSNALTPATCTEDGHLTVTCNSCGEIVKDESIAALGHNASYIEGTAAGCTTEGSIPYYICTRCSRYFSDATCTNEIKLAATIVDPVGHNASYVGQIEPTCGTEGISEHYYCAVCDSYFTDAEATVKVDLVDLTIPAYGHTVIHTPASPATCAADGNIDYYTCDDCGCIFSDEDCTNQISISYTIIPALDHELEYFPVEEATCTEPGLYAYYFCPICNIYYSDVDATEIITEDDLIVPPHGHDIVFTDRIEPACTESGIIAHYYCNTCDQLFSDAEATNEIAEEDILIEAIGHSYTSSVTPAGCLEDGFITYTCENCKDSYETPISATGHNYTAVDTAPTCTEGGYTTYTCENCGDSYTGNNTEASGHNYSNGVCVNCGEGDGSNNLDETIVINHTLNLASDISIIYAVKTSLLASYESYYLQCVIPTYDGNSLSGNSTVILQPVLNGSYYYFTLTGVTSVQIGDMIEATLYMEKDGTTYVSQVDTYSVATYAYNQLAKSTASEELKSLCANLLRYGASAQLFKDYRTDAYADATMTEEQKSYLIDLDTITFGNNNRTLGDVTNASIAWVGKVLDLNSKITIKFVFSIANYTGNTEDLNLQVSYLDYLGQEQTAVVSACEKYGSNENYYCFAFDGLLAAELRQVLSIAVYEGTVQVSETLEYSADTYGNGKTGNLLNICKAMMAYSDSALAFFKN